MENRRKKAMAEGQIKYKYLYEAIGLLARSCQVGNTKTPYQLDDLNFNGLH